MLNNTNYTQKIYDVKVAWSNAFRKKFNGYGEWKTLANLLQIFACFYADGQALRICVIRTPATDCRIL